jgi:hypothetical protein
MKTSLATILLLLGVDAITVPKKSSMVSIDITKTSYKNERLMQIESMNVQDPIFLSQYNDAINFA